MLKPLQTDPETEDRSRADTLKSCLNLGILPGLAAAGLSSAAPIDQPGPEAAEPPAAVSLDAEFADMTLRAAEQAPPRAAGQSSLLPEDPEPAFGAPLDFSADSEPPLPQNDTPPEPPPAGSEQPDSQRPESPDSWGKAFDKLSRGVIVVLSVLGFIGALRGTLKAAAYLHGKWKSRQRFKNRQFLDVMPCNLHRFTEHDGQLSLEVFSLANTPISTAIPNDYAAGRFTKAARKCTRSQPFPSLELPPSTDGDGISGINRTNKYLRESFSSLFRTGALADTMGIRTFRETMLLIPICEVFPAGARHGRALILAAIPERDFKRFADPKEVERMSADSPRLAPRLKTLKMAYRHQLLYKAEHGLDKELFPKVVVFLKGSPAKGSN